MKTTKHTESPSVPGPARKLELQPAPHHDPLKDHQKIPLLPVVPEDAERPHQVPANELEFANFYHL